MDIIFTLHPLLAFRFREVYYWDTYWIVVGLLACHMAETARYRVIQNLFKGLYHEVSHLRLVFESKCPPTGPEVPSFMSYSRFRI